MSGRVGWRVVTAALLALLPGSSMAEEDLQAAALDQLLARGDAPAVAELQRRFGTATERLDRMRIASVLVRRLENDAPYFALLEGEARKAIESDMPFPYASDLEGNLQPKQYAPAFLRWANAQGTPPDAAVLYALQTAPLDVLLLTLADDARARDLLLKGVDSPNYLVAYRAAWGLARLRDLSAVPRIVKAAEGAPRDAGQVIARALVLFDAPEAQAAADRLIPDVEVRQALRARAPLELRMNIGEATGSLTQNGGAR